MTRGIVPDRRVRPIGAESCEQSPAKPDPEAAATGSRSGRAGHPRARPLPFGLPSVLVERRRPDATVVVRLSSSISGIVDYESATLTVEPVAYPIGPGDGIRSVDF